MWMSPAQRFFHAVLSAGVLVIIFLAFHCSRRKDIDSHPNGSRCGRILSENTTVMMQYVPFTLISQRSS